MRACVGLTVHVLGALVAAGCGISAAGEGPPGNDDGSAPALDGSGSAADQQGPADDATADSGDAPATPDVGESGDAGFPPDASDAPEEQDGAGDAASTESGPVSDGYSIGFDGASSLVDCGSVPIPKDFTLEAWVKPSGYDGETYVVAEDERNYAQGQFRFGFVPGGQLFFYMTDASGNDHGLYSGQYNLVSSAPVATNAWSEVAVTKSGAVFALYLGGVQVASFTASAAFSFGNGGLQLPLRIGSRVAPNGTGSDGVFSGLVDEVRLWSAPRTAAQIQASMGGEIPPNDPAWSTLQDYWPFDEGSGTTTVDRRGKYPGTLMLGPSWVKDAPF